MSTSIAALHLGHTAIRGKVYARTKRGTLGDEEQRSRCHFLRSSDSTQRQSAIRGGRAVTRGSRNRMIRRIGRIMSPLCKEPNETAELIGPK